MSDYSQVEIQVEYLQGRVVALAAERDEARAEVARRDALIRADGYEDMRQHAQELAVKLEAAQAEFGRANARALEAERLSGDWQKYLYNRDVERAKVAKLRAALGPLMDPTADQTYCLTGDCGQCQECAARAALRETEDAP